MTRRLVWNENGSAEIMSVAELDALLDDLASRAEKGDPFMVELSAENGDLMSLGLGQDMSVLSYTPASLDPPYLASVGEENEENDGVIVFNYAGQETEFPLASAVPTSDAREAFRVFFETGALADNIQWAEV
jgi:hypothetical protein